MPPKLQYIYKENGVKVQVTRSRGRLDWDFTRTYQRLKLNENVFHCFNEVDTLKELSSGHLVSFFKELDTRKEPCSGNLIIMKNKSSLPRVPLPMEGKHPGSQDPMPPAPDAQWHYHWVQARGK